MIEFGDLRPFKDIGLIHSTSKGQARYGTFRFWSPTSYREYYIKSYAKKSAHRNIWVKCVHDSKGQGTGLRHCTWSEAVSWIEAKNRHFTLKIEKMLKKSFRRPGDAMWTVGLDNIFLKNKWDAIDNGEDFDEAVFQAKCACARSELIGHLTQLREHFTDLKIARLWCDDNDRNVMWEKLSERLQHTQQPFFRVEGRDAASAISFLRATYRAAVMVPKYWIPCQVGPGAGWDMTSVHPSKWIAEGP